MTVTDLLAAARDESDQQRQETLLHEAEGAAAADATFHAQSFLDIAGLHHRACNTTAARRCIEFALDHADDCSLWVYRNAATLWLSMAEPQRAREALFACENAFMASDDSAGYMWQLLAEGWIADFTDRESASRCLDQANAEATDVDDHCSISAGLRELLGDEKAADAALRRAEELAEHSERSHDWWTIANTYSKRDDTDGVRASLERGASIAASVKGLLTIVAAWHCHFPSSDEVTKCLRVADTRAQTVDDWLEIAEASSDYEGDKKALGRRLQQALQLSSDASERLRIARGYRLWLDDAETARTIAPAGLVPDEVAGTCIRLEGWHADAAALLNWLRPQITPEILESIAQADYSTGAGKHRAVLTEIIDSGLVPHPLEWHPQEVLQLTRWQSGAHVDHLERAFACTLLCIEGSAPFSECSEADIIILLESCIELGRNALRSVIGLFVAMVEGTADAGDDDDDDDDDPWMWSAAVFGLLLAAATQDPTDIRLGPLAARLVADQAVTQALFTDDMRPKVWHRLAAQIVPTMLEAQADVPAIQALAALLPEP